MFNGERRQRYNTRDMVFSFGECLAFLSRDFTLYPGDIISTGTPEGVSPIVPGDKVVATIENIGTIKVNVRAA